uniref:Uncharacterized protein n=1 Tax=Clytia hemisphaerica TaxID=252671 RepID=A0A7M5UJQ9_9CNID
MRKITNDGVLVIYDIRYEDDDFQTLNKMKLKWKRYGKLNNDFKEGESPYQYLVDGDILLIEDYRLISGFDWKNVIIIITDGNTGKVDYHPCNFIMRCMMNLMIVDNKEADIFPDETDTEDSSDDTDTEDSSDDTDTEDSSDD